MDQRTKRMNIRCKTPSRQINIEQSKSIDMLMFENIYTKLSIAIDAGSIDKFKVSIAEAIHKGFPVDYQPITTVGKGWTLLHHAIRRGENRGGLEFIKILLEYHADPSVKTSGGWSSLALAVDNLATNTVNLLLNVWNKENTLEPYLFVMACQKYIQSMYYYDPNTEEKVLQIISLLLKHGITVDYDDILKRRGLPLNKQEREKYDSLKTIIEAYRSQFSELKNTLSRSEYEYEL